MIHDQKGVTIIELLIAVSLASIISVVMISITLTFLGNTVRSQIRAEMAINSHFALRAIVEDVRLGSSIGATNTLTDDNEPFEGWNTDSSDNVIIINRPATDDSENVIYNELTDNPYNNEFIYYLDNGVLKKRILKNTLATDNKVRTTCPEDQATSECPRDPELAEHVAGFSFELLDVQNNVTTDPSLARSIRLSLSMERTAFGNPVLVSNSLTTKLRNY